MELLRSKKAPGRRKTGQFAGPMKLPDRLIVLRQCNIRDAIRTGKAATKIGTIAPEISIGGIPTWIRAVWPRCAKYEY